MSRKIAWFTTIAAMLISATSWAHGPTPFGEPGNRARVSRTVEVLMNEADGRMNFTPNEITINRGDTVRFVARNGGVLEHELVIDTVEGNQRHRVQMERNPDMEHDDPNAVRVAPNANGEVIWRFTNAGTFEYACLIPGHYEAGMHGRIIVR